MRATGEKTGETELKSTGTSKKREAEKIAAKWEAELQEGRYRKRSRIRWEDFVDRFDESLVGRVKPSTVDSYLDSLPVFSKICRPTGARDLTTARISRFVVELRKPYKRKKSRIGEEPEDFYRSDATIARHLRHIKAACNWAHRQGYLAELPQFDMPKGGDKMKGRPITEEEVAKMLTATEAIVGEAASDSWKLLLRGLWASGLRLGEALALRWEPQPGGIWLILNGTKSVLAFDGGSQKSGKTELVPLAPEAVTLLEPYQENSGFVFVPLRQDGKPMARDRHKIGKVITSIGAKAGICVDQHSGKMASAHDLRRAFGFRWSRRVMPPVLKTLMRHSKIETTMKFYVGQEAERTAEEVWEAVPDTLSDSYGSEKEEIAENT